MGVEADRVTDAVSFHFFNSWLSGRHIATPAGELSLLPDMFSLRDRSIPAAWRPQRGAIDRESYSSLSPLSSRWIRPGSLNG